MSKKTYRVTLYVRSELIFDRDYSTKARAAAMFMEHAGTHATDPGACVLLTWGDMNSGSVLAHKSAQSDRTIFERGYFEVRR